MQCVFAPASYKPGLTRKLDDTPGITGGPWQMRPLSRGYVLARAPGPHDQPAINPRLCALSPRRPILRNASRPRPGRLAGKILLPQHRPGEEEDPLDVVEEVAETLA